MPGGCWLRSCEQRFGGECSFLRSLGRLGMICLLLLNLVGATKVGSRDKNLAKSEHLHSHRDASGRSDNVARRIMRAESSTVSSEAKDQMSELGVDCTFNDWSDWQACSLTCGTASATGEITPAKRKRTRTVKTGSCPDPVETADCPIQVCPVDCAWEAWGSWSSCPVTCGPGQASRSRVRKEARNGGRACQGPRSEEQACSVQICESVVVGATTPTPAPTPLGTPLIQAKNVTGIVSLAVSNVDAFIADVGATHAIITAISALAGSPVTVPNVLCGFEKSGANENEHANLKAFFTVRLEGLGTAGEALEVTNSRAEGIATKFNKTTETAATQTVQEKMLQEVQLHQEQLPYNVRVVSMSGAVSYVTLPSTAAVTAATPAPTPTAAPTILVAQAQAVNAPAPSADPSDEEGPLPTPRPSPQNGARRQHAFASTFMAVLIVAITIASGCSIPLA